jgi:hypothetical protein
MTMAKAGKRIPRFSPSMRDVRFRAAAHTWRVYQLHMNILLASCEPCNEPEDNL